MIRLNISKILNIIIIQGNHEILARIRLQQNVF